MHREGNFTSLGASACKQEPGTTEWPNSDIGRSQLQPSGCKVGRLAAQGAETYLCLAGWLADKSRDGRVPDRL